MSDEPTNAANTGKGRQAKDKPADRQQRLAAQLRENLKKRKDLARAKKNAEGERN